MTRTRAVAALAALITALLLQSTLIGPWTLPAPVSLPAVLVAVVALHDGPAAGMSFGFVAGLVADLSSRHPVGVLALCWMGLGLVAGMGAMRRSVRGDAAMAALLAALAGLAASAMLIVTHADGVTARSVALGIVPAVLGNAIVALLIVPPVRRFLRTDTLRAPHPVFTELVVADA